jgi:hypothetical protein
MPTITTLICLVIAAVILAAFWWQARQRSLALRRLASKFGFAFLGTTLPGSLNLTATGPEAISSCWNVMDGELSGARILVFDCRIGEGKGSWRRTIIAAKGNADIFGSVPLVLALTSEPAGDWTVLYQPKTYRIIPPGLMAASELDALLELFSSGENTSAKSS